MTKELKEFAASVQANARRAAEVAAEASASHQSPKVDSTDEASRFVQAIQDRKANQDKANGLG